MARRRHEVRNFARPLWNLSLRVALFRVVLWAVCFVGPVHPLTDRSDEWTHACYIRIVQLYDPNVNLSRSVCVYLRCDMFCFVSKFSWFASRSLARRDVFWFNLQRVWREKFRVWTFPLSIGLSRDIFVVVFIEIFIAYCNAINRRCLVINTSFFSLVLPRFIDELYASLRITSSVCFCCLLFYFFLCILDKLNKNVVSWDLLYLKFDIIFF